MYRIKPYLCNFVYNLKDNRNMAITFFAEGVKLPAIKKRETGDWIKNVAGIYGKKCGDISYIFCNVVDIGLTSPFLSSSFGSEQVYNPFFSA